MVRLYPKPTRPATTGVPFDGMAAVRYAGLEHWAAAFGCFLVNWEQEKNVANRVPAYGLAKQGIATSAELHWNLGTPALVEHAIARGEGMLAKDGPLVVETGKHTGRSAKDKFI